MASHMFITGASRGLGAACAEHFGRMGAKLALVARSEDAFRKIRDALPEPSRCKIILADLSDPKQVRLAAEQAIEFLGDIDAVLHCLGGGLGLKSPLLSHEDLSKLFMVNVGAAIELNRIIAPKMIARKKGNLVHVGSIASTEAVGSVGYNTVKAALIAYVKSIGRELARDQVIATGISPGGFIAPGNAMDRLKTNHPEAYQNFIDQRLPLGVVPPAGELLPMMELLAKPDARMFAGCMVPMDAAEGKAYFSV